MRDRNAPLTLADVASLDWAKSDGLIPAIVQDCDTLQLLMLGYMSREALGLTLENGLATFYSRSRGRLWQKGETSGNALKVREIFADCDGDALLVRAEPLGPTCHLGTPSCFEERGPGGIGALGSLSRTIRERRGSDPQGSYTASLLGEGQLKVSQKVGEEGLELALAGAAEDKERCIEECADLLYHVAVLMEARGFDWNDVGQALAARRKPVRSTPV